MGCHKLTYYPVLDLVKNEFKNELTLNKSDLKGCRDYLYGFENQEVDNEIKGKGNSINFKYRMYDPRLCRFPSVDPLAWKYPFYSPYQFSSNSPIISVELEGLESAVILNYNEGSVRIDKGQDGKQFLVTQADVQKINKLKPQSVRPGDGTRDISPGGTLDVYCSGCGTGQLLTITLPKLRVQQTTTIQVPKTIPGTPGKDAKYKNHDKSTGKSTSAVGNVNTDMSSIRTQLSGLSEDAIKKVKDGLIGNKNEKFVERTGLGIGLGTDATDATIAAVKKEFESAFPSLDINVRRESGTTNGISVKTSFSTKEKISDAVDEVPDQTIMINETISTTVDPVVVIP